MTDTIRTITTAAVGEGAIMATDATIPDETIQLALQVIIGIVTLIKLFKTNKRKR